MPVLDYRQCINRDPPNRERAWTDARSRSCPRCGSGDAIRIVYGLPGNELVAASERGEVALGGCAIGDESPDYECRACGAPLPWNASDD